MADANDVLKKVGALIKLAQSDNEEEARTAAMQATRLMAENKLVLVPQSEIDRIQKSIGEMKMMQAKSESEAQQKMLIGALLGWVVSKQGLL